MSAFLDSLSGAGYDGSEDGGIGDVGSADNPATSSQTASGGGYFSGLLQATTALGTGYLSRRLDIDLYQRAVGAQAYPTLGTTQNGVLIRQAGVPQPGGVARGGQTLLNINALMPYLLVAAAVFFIAKKA